MAGFVRVGVGAWRDSCEWRGVAWHGGIRASGDGVAEFVRLRV